MSGGWTVAFVALALVVVVQGGLLVGLIRRVDAALARNAQSAYLMSPMESGLAPGTAVPDFGLRDASGRQVMAAELWKERPALVLLTSHGCSACRRLIDDLVSRPWHTPDVKLVVIGVEGEPAVYPSMFTQVDEAASAALDSSVSPHAFLVDRGGIVVDRRIPQDMHDLYDLAGLPTASPVP